MSSGRAGVVTPGFIAPVLKGDSVSGTLAFDVNLNDMPKPLLNPVYCNVQLWFVPKSSFPQFAGTDEFLNSYTSTSITALGAADRAPPPYFVKTNSDVAKNSELFKTLGIHTPTGAEINVDYIDAFNMVYNFRLAAHSSKLPLKEYWQEDTAKAVALPPAFWPSGRFKDVVADYERALILGSLDLDVSAGKIPIHGLRYKSTNEPSGGFINPASGQGATLSDRKMLTTQATGLYPEVWGAMEGQTVSASLADIDKARTTQAFAKLRTAYAGNDSTGFMSDEMILAYLMQGISVPNEYYRRPWMLGQQRVAFGFAERHATDGPSLDASITSGRTRVQLSCNVPMQDVGGYIVATIEVLPERLDERQTDEAVFITTVEQLPNALRDVQRKEPVDSFLNRRVDAKHSTPNGLYGYEPMNNVWNRSFTKLGGVFYQPDPADPFTESRAGIWQAGIVDALYNEDHFLAPQPFPHNVFSDTAAPAFEFVVRHNLSIVGLTQIGDVLAENNDDYGAIEDGGISDGNP